MINLSTEVEPARTAIATMKKRGTEIILEALLEQGIDKLFGYPGGCVIPLFDEVLNYPELEMILVRHEQAAAHAADGLARVTGKAQVVVVTSGPGATNTITGIATALMDSVPMVVITGQVRRAVIGTDAFQETNVVGVSRPVTKHNYLVKDTQDLRKIIREAFYIAETGKPGPVLIDIPVDVQREEIIEKPLPKKVQIRGYEPYPKVDSEKLAKAWELIQAAKKPIIYAGGGINLSNAARELIDFATTTNIPVATTLLGQGVFPEDHQLGLGMLGMHGTYAANMAMLRTDLAIAIGARFDDRVTGKTDEFLSQAKILHVDVDPSCIGKVKKPDLGIVSDAKTFLRSFKQFIKPLPTEPWLAELHELIRKEPLPNYDDTDSAKDALRPEYVLKELSKATKGQAIIVTDVGQHQMFTCLHYQFKRARSHITSGGLGTMGFSLPAAMGIALKEKDLPVISISGDGGYQMNLQELATIRTYNIPVKIVVFNNSNLGMVKQWQDFFWDKRYASTIFDQNPNFVKIAEAYDIPAHVARTKPEVPEMIQTLLNTKGPVFLEFKIDKDAHVYPMIPSGGRLSDIIIRADK